MLRKQSATSPNSSPSGSTRKPVRASRKDNVTKYRLCKYRRRSLFSVPPEPDRIPEALEEFLANEKVLKIGLSLRDDFGAMRKRTDIQPANFLDLQNYVGQFGIEDASLQKIYAILFNKKISKGQRLSNWEADVLSDAQKKYAALDAWPA